ncbi:hypothetical protein LCGC14_0865650 [marine sediment metagenome]|uniref:Peptidase M15C domain-containing protein n=1 Tax=marine sediment metagenome TaxID=412755 RepID=A0A0F9P665_9ZZZZ
MRLGEKQELFAQLYAEHIIWLHTCGYEVRLGDVFAREGHREGSNHYIKLAGDINLFKNGEYITTTMGHRESGEKWESRHELCRWGGNWDKDDHPGEPGEDDGNHYSLLHNGRM